MAPTALVGETGPDQGVVEMAQTRNIPRAAPVVQMLMGLRSQVRPAKQPQNNSVTVEAFEREHMGIAAKE